MEELFRRNNVASNISFYNTRFILTTQESTFYLVGREESSVPTWHFKGASYTLMKLKDIFNNDNNIMGGLTVHFCSGRPLIPKGGGI